MDKSVLLIYYWQINMMMDANKNTYLKQFGFTKAMAKLERMNICLLCTKMLLFFSASSCKKKSKYWPFLFCHRFTTKYVGCRKKHKHGQIKVFTMFSRKEFKSQKHPLRPT